MKKEKGMGLFRGRKKNAPVEPEHREPPVEAQGVELERRDGPPRFWPAGEALPAHVVKARHLPQPCPMCRRIRLDSGSQCGAVTSSAERVVHYRCRACGHRWKLPVRRV